LDYEENGKDSYIRNSFHKLIKNKGFGSRRRQKLPVSHYKNIGSEKNDSEKENTIFN